jgi:hypothetical protein
MKYKLAVFSAVLLCAGGMTATSAQAAGISIEIGDHGYYNHGPWYYNHGVRWYWVSGHWRWHHGNRYWLHGHYAPR